LKLGIQIFYAYFDIIFCPFQIAVVVFPTPEELKIRSDKRFTEMGKEVPLDAVNKMIGIASLFFFSLLSASFKSSYGLFILFTVWQLIMFCLKARICLIQMKLLIRCLVTYLSTIFVTVIVNHYFSTSLSHVLPKFLFVPLGYVCRTEPKRVSEIFGPDEAESCMCI